MKRRFFLILLAACLGLTACQAQNLPGAQTPTEPKAPETNEPAPTDTLSVETLPTEPEPTNVLPEIPDGKGLGLNELDGRADIAALDVQDLLCAEIDNPEDLAAVSSKLKEIESRTVYMCFSSDIIHGGHIAIIKKAQKR